jgi:CRP-like cAMP-binding protein
MLLPQRKDDDDTCLTSIPSTSVVSAPAAGDDSKILIQEMAILVQKLQEGINTLQRRNGNAGESLQENSSVHFNCLDQQLPRPSSPNNGGQDESDNVVVTRSISSRRAQILMTSPNKRPELKPVWVRISHRRAQQMVRSGVRTSLRRGGRSTTLDSDIMNGVNDNVRASFCAGSKQELAWDIFGLWLIAYEIFTAPLQVFDPPMYGFEHVLAWVSPLYWTTDIALRLMILFCDADRAAVCAYFKRWFFFDVLCVVVDWLSLMAANTVDNLALIRIVKFLRFIRLIRLLKIQGRLESSEYRIRANKILILIGMARSLATILGLCHFLACGWYGVGLPNRFSNGYSWLNEFDVRTRPWHYRYFMCLHWALAQFTPATVEIHPTNTVERNYAVFVVIVAMISFTSLVGNMTASIAQLSTERRDQQRKEGMLRRYMDEHRIDDQTRLRIFVYLKAARTNSLNLLHEQDVELIAHLPNTLRKAMRIEIFSHLFESEEAHPLFKYISEDIVHVQRLCNNALVETAGIVEKEIIAEGTHASHMYIIKKGSLMFNAEERALTVSKPHLLTPDGPAHLRYFSEICLWLQWSHCGSVTAKTHVELIELCEDYFQRELSTDPAVISYAYLFLAYVKEHPDQSSDVMTAANTCEDLEGLVCTARGDVRTPLKSPSEASGNGANGDNGVIWFEVKEEDEISNNGSLCEASI